MSCFKTWRRSRLRALPILLLTISIIWSCGVRRSEAQSDTKTPSRSEQVEQFLQEAEAYFEKQEFIASYELYRRVLSLDSTNEPARGKIYEIARIYQTLEKIARQEQDEEQAKLLYQQHRSIVRYLLSVLTQQLDLEFQTYSKLNLLKETGGDIKNDVIPVLQNLLKILRELKNIYEHFPREGSGTEKVIERLNDAIKKYEKELAHYQE